MKRREPEPCMPVAKSSAQGFENKLATATVELAGARIIDLSIHVSSKRG